MFRSILLLTILSLNTNVVLGRIGNKNVFTPRSIDDTSNKFQAGSEGKRRRQRKLSSSHGHGHTEGIAEKLHERIKIWKGLSEVHLGASGAFGAHSNPLHGHHHHDKKHEKKSGVRKLRRRLSEEESEENDVAVRDLVPNFAIP